MVALAVKGESLLALATHPPRCAQREVDPRGFTRRVALEDHLSVLQSGLSDDPAHDVLKRGAGTVEVRGLPAHMLAAFGPAYGLVHGLGAVPGMDRDRTKLGADRLEQRGAQRHQRLGLRGAGDVGLTGARARELSQREVRRQVHRLPTIVSSA